MKFKHALHGITLGILLVAACAWAQTSKCPPKGDSPTAKLQALDLLKNRIEVGKPVELLLSDVLATGADQTRFKETQYVKIQGYIILVKAGGSETCNCHSKNAVDKDIHIELAATPNGKPTTAMVCEVSRYTEPNVGMNLKQVGALKGHKVELEGWLFFDGEHAQNALNTNPKGTDLWRATCWEIHPVQKITVLTN